MALEFVTVATIHDVPAGELASYDVGGTRVAVANVEGSFHAFDDICTHQQCSLAEGDLDETTVTCPCHGSQFDVTTGTVLAPPAVRPVRSYRVRVEGDALQVSL
jgi:3-phenylpropionate/trans-cinnamate dioxygenase ferredoxin component